MYKVIVSDLDGTLLNAQHRISDYTEDLIRFVLSKGIPFIIATGRHYRDVVGLTQNLGESLCTITSNGARAHDGFGKLLYQQNMTSVEAKEILTIAAGFNVHQNVYDGDRWLVEQPDLGLLAMHPSGFAYEEVKLLSEPLDNVAKTFFVGDALNVGIFTALACWDLMQLKHNVLSEALLIFLKSFVYPAWHFSANGNKLNSHGGLFSCVVFATFWRHRPEFF